MMRNILLIGLGRFGQYTAEKLNELRQQVMAVDIREEQVNKVLGFVTSAQIGDATDENFLATLGVDNYDVCIVAIGDDFLASLVVTSLLKDMGARYVVSRATGKSQAKLLKRNGADEIVFPEKQLASWTAIRCSYEGLSSYIELQDGYSIVEIAVPKEWDSQTIGALSIRSRYDINVLGIRTGGEMQMHIDADTVVHAEDRMMVLGKENAIRKCFHLR